MSEELLYFVWKFGLYKSYSLFGIDSKDFQIINPGTQNRNAGPDFFAAQIKSGGTIFAGNVEIHLKSSDWIVHGHNSDKAYNNVILQVVTEHDKEIKTENGRLIPVMKISVNNAIEQKYSEYKNNRKWIACQDDISMVDDFKSKIWLGKVLVERLSQKSDYFEKVLELNKNSWEETFYQMLARNFGFRINSEPFEWLAKSLPMNYLAKHKSNLLQIESLLYGQAGFLESSQCNDQYFIDLQKEYQFLKSKFSLIPVEKYLWKFLRLRPSNFPTIRISQLAMLIHKSKSLFSKIINSENITEIRDMFAIEASSYWSNHYTFGKESIYKRKTFGEQSIDNLLINTVIPLLFLYGLKTNNQETKEKAINFLEEIKPESNQIIASWKKAGIKVENAFYSQALLQQKSHYCNKTKCLECGVGIEILKKQINTDE